MILRAGSPHFWEVHKGGLMVCREEEMSPWRFLQISQVTRLLWDILWAKLVTFLRGWPWTTFIPSLMKAELCCMQHACAQHIQGRPSWTPGLCAELSKVPTLRPTQSSPPVPFGFPFHSLSSLQTTWYVLLNKHYKLITMWDLYTKRSKACS